MDWIVTYRSFVATKHYLGCISCYKNLTIENHEILQILVVSYRNVRSEYTEDFRKKEKKSTQMLKKKIRYHHTISLKAEMAKKMLL